MKRIFIPLITIFILTTCATGDPEADYFGTTELDTRGMIYVSEAHWSGSVKDDGGLDNPDDDFIEFRNWYKGDLDIGGWTIVIVGQSYALIQIPVGTVIPTKEYYTVGNNTNGAFAAFDLICSNFVLPSGGFTISIYDGGGQKEADSVDFGEDGIMPAGYDLPALRKSAVRLTDYFGPVSALESWVTYNATAPNDNVRTGYRNSVYASPGTSLGESGESANEE